MATPGTVNHAYSPNDEVWVITDGACPQAVQKGTVVTCDIQLLVTTSTINYEVRLDGNSGTNTFAEADVYPDTAAALAAYALLIA